MVAGAEVMRFLPVSNRGTMKGPAEAALRRC
jgi:hypothetical protein